MISIDEIWEELFEAIPTEIERRVLENLEKFYARDDASFIACALIVRLFSESMLLDPASPVNLVGRMGKALAQLEIKSKRLDKQFVELSDWLNSMNVWAYRVDSALSEATKFVENRRNIPAPVLQLNPATGSPYWEHTLAPNALRDVAFAAGVGGLISGVIIIFTGWILITL